MERPRALSPGFWAPDRHGLLAFPYTVLVLYPPLARLDPTWWRPRGRWAPRRVRLLQRVVPGCATRWSPPCIMVFVFALGSYLLPQILGRPQHWTLSVLITDQAIYQSNMPFAAAMAVSSWSCVAWRWWG